MDFNRYSLNTYFLLMRRLISYEMMKFSHYYFFFFVIFKLLHLSGWTPRSCVTSMWKWTNELFLKYVKFLYDELQNIHTTHKHLKHFHNQKHFILTQLGLHSVSSEIVLWRSRIFFLKAQLYNESKENGNFH